VRGPEARTLVDALNTGHRGMLATIHANSAAGALRRLSNLATRGPAHYQVPSVDADIKSGIDWAVHLMRDVRRRYVQEVLDCSADRS